MHGYNGGNNTGVTDDYAYQQGVQARNAEYQARFDASWKQQRAETSTPSFGGEANSSFESTSSGHNVAGGAEGFLPVIGLIFLTPWLLPTYGIHLIVKGFSGLHGYPAIFIVIAVAIVNIVVICAILNVLPENVAGGIGAAQTFVGAAVVLGLKGSVDFNAANVAIGALMLIGMPAIGFISYRSASRFVQDN